MSMRPDRAQRVASYLCMTKDIGVGGNLFGGTMMSWMDEAAGIHAHRYTGVMRMVTLRYSELLFREPIRVGDIVDIYALNERVGRTSITFDLEGWVENRTVFHTTTTFVAVDSQGRPMPIPESSDESSA